MLKLNMRADALVMGCEGGMDVVVERRNEAASGMLFVDPGRNHTGLWRIRPEAPGLNQYLEWAKRTVGILELIEKRPHHARVEESVHCRLGSRHCQPFR
jgi:hypothetical protein